MAFHFKEQAIEAEQFIQTLAKEFGEPDDLQKAGRVLRATFHVLRKHLPFNESLQLIAQFPLFLKGMYVDGWHISSSKNKKHRLFEFMEELRTAAGATGNNDFPDTEHTEKLVRSVFRSLRKYVSLGELEDIRSVLPKDLKSLLNTHSFI